VSGEKSPGNGGFMRCGTNVSRNIFYTFFLDILGVAKREK
jgi:hypothetical protein